ncbi:MAG TPA: helix-turn-helix domain-containing protein [Gemmataceae bacterium]|nr:helix-turn-helix domain-containing protein [Gemmataceae bacterium]
MNRLRPITAKLEQQLKLTPPELARRWGVSPDKVLAWIHSGELRATNAARSAAGRPRWLIDVADIVVFERRRMASPSVRVTRRRRPTDVIAYF